MSFNEIPNKYDSNIEEIKVKDFWKSNKTFSLKNPKKWNSDKIKKIYAIDTPPPTVSGKMHIGHSYSYSQQDFIARYKRMNGLVYYPFGTDDNGLPTERLIEKLNKVKSKSMSRTDFIKLCNESLKKITPDFIEDWVRLGVSCDYDYTYSTIDTNSQKLSQGSFLELAKRGEIYKKKFPTIWCTECQTAIAQAELEDKEIPSLFTTIKFTVDGKELLIATTRPELLPACVAVFINPNDERYKHIVGKKAKVPIFNFEVPVIEDASASIEKGTGVLMICSYGDKFDADAINRHKLTPNVIIENYGKLKSIEKTGAYAGLKIKDARLRILEDLKTADLIVEQKPITHNVNVHDKCGTEIEFIPTEQWFIKVLDKKEMLVEQGKKINWYPSFMFKRYQNWIEGLDWDWSISRDRHFGIPIPAWHCRTCDKIIFAEESELPVDPIQTKKNCPTCGKETESETKVLDTWATSSISPQIASSLVNNEITIPYSLRPQAHDIIRTWAFYTITRSYLKEKQIPWKDIVISGFVTLGGEKMSKSKGNVIDPQGMVKMYGADALRFWAAGPSLGEDLDYQEKDLISGKKIVQKVWNSYKFTSLFLKTEDKTFNPNNVPTLTAMDKWMLNELNQLIEKTTYHFEHYEFEKVKYLSDNFFWNVFCDSYLELVKDRLYKPEIYGMEAHNSAKYTLYHVLKTLVQILHPITPFVTEAVWQYFFTKFGEEESISISNWPTKYNIEISKDELIAGKLATDLTSALRRHKADNNKPLNNKIKLNIFCGDKNKKYLDMVKDDISGTAKTESINYVGELDIRKDIVINATAIKKDLMIIDDNEEIIIIGVDFIEEQKPKVE